MYYKIQNEHIRININNNMKDITGSNSGNNEDVPNMTNPVENIKREWIFSCL